MVQRQIILNKSFVGYQNDYSVAVTRLPMFMQLKESTKCICLPKLIKGHICGTNEKQKCR